MRSPAARIGILGDIHAEDELLDLALRHLAREDLDAILAVGDIVDGKGSVDACCDALREAGALVVRGNHERWLLRDDMRHLPDSTSLRGIAPRTRDFLEALPTTLRIPTVLGELLLCHGTGDDDMCAVRPDDFGYALEVNEALQTLLRDGRTALVVCGHSHQRMVRRFGPLTIVNAGTLYRGHQPCFGTIDLRAGGTREVTFFERGGDERDEVAIAGVFPLPGVIRTGD